MDLPPNFYPVLHPADWPGREHCAHRSLLAGGECPLLVSYAIVSEDSNQTLPNAALEGTGESIETLEQLAVNNWLASFADAPWETMEPEPGTSLVMARMESDAFSSGIVSPGLCKGMQRTLGAEMIHLGVPDRFTIVASNEPVRFLSVVAGMYEDAVHSGMAPLSPAVFVAQEGNIVGWSEPEGGMPSTTETSGLTPVPGELVLGMVAAATTMINVGEGDSEPRLNRWFALLEQHAESPEESIARAVAVAFGNNPESFINEVMQGVGADPVSMLGVVQAGLDEAGRTCDRRGLADYQGLLLDVVRAIPGSPPTAAERSALEMHEMLILGED